MGGRRPRVKADPLTLSHTPPQPHPDTPPFPHLPCPQSQFGSDDVEPEGAQLWFAGKQMSADKKLSEYVGRHEKTKAIVKLQKRGSGAPSREPVGALAPWVVVRVWWGWKGRARVEGLRGRMGDRRGGTRARLLPRVP